MTKHVTKDKVGLEKAPGRGKYKQRRKHHRLECLTPLDFSFMEADGTEESFSEEMNAGLMKNLSGGGIRMAAEFDMTEEDLIKFTLELDKELFELIGRIRYKIHDPDYCLPYLYGIMFMKLSADKRERIVLHLHRRQLVYLRHLNIASRNYRPAKGKGLTIPNQAAPAPQAAPIAAGEGCLNTGAF